MTRRILFSALALLAFASVAYAGIVDPENSSATMNNEPGIMTIAPGGGDSFLNPVDHRIDVYLQDSDENWVEVVASDIWLSNVTASFCPGGVIADSGTYAPDPGHTTFTGTPRGGIAGNTAPCRVTLTDVVAVGNSIQELNLRFNSADLNGDGEVTLADLGIFASCFNLPCSDSCFCADLDESGQSEPEPCVVLADLAVFASYYNLSEYP